MTGEDRKMLKRCGWFLCRALGQAIRDHDHIDEYGAKACLQWLDAKLAATELLPGQAIIEATTEELPRWKPTLPLSRASEERAMPTELDRCFRCGCTKAEHNDGKPAFGITTGWLLGPSTAVQHGCTRFIPSYSWPTEPGLWVSQRLREPVKAELSLGEQGVCVWVYGDDEAYESVDEWTEMVITDSADLFTPLDLSGLFLEEEHANEA